MKPARISSLILLLGALAIDGTKADGAITVVHQWNLGEQDAVNAVPGPGDNPTVAAVGGINLARTGAPQYEASGVPGGGSTHAASFANTYGGSHLGTAVDFYHDFTVDYDPTSPANWGIEAWVKLDSVPVNPPQQEAAVFHIGTFVAGSLILQTFESTPGVIAWAVHGPGAIIFTGPAVTPGAWTHLAAVNNAGTMELYVDGTLAGAQFFGNRNPAAGVTIGASFLNGVAGVQHGRGIDGSVDGARIFEFDEGQFSIEDTLYQGIPDAPPPSHPGDFDADGDVDGADFVAWQTNFPKATGALPSEGDADADGDVDGADFVVWQTNFPFTPGSGTAPVPEPHSIALAFAGTICWIGKSIRGRRDRK